MFFSQLSHGRKQRIKRYMRIYRYLLSNDREHFVSSVLRGVSKSVPPSHLSDLKIFLEGKALRDAQISVQQYILRRINFIRLTETILLGIDKENGKLDSVSVPSNYINYLLNNDIKVHALKSKFKWCLSCMVYLMRGFFEVFKISLNRNNKNESYFLSQSSEGFCSFQGLNDNNLPIKSVSKSFTIIDWYIREGNNLLPIIAQNKSCYFENIKGTDVLASTKNLPSLNSLKSRLYFFVHSFFIGIIASVYLCVGRWTLSLMFFELVHYLQYKYLPNEFKPKQVYFNNSGWFHRPLWTYLLEDDGGQVCCYFYSLNTFQFYAKGKGKAIQWGWELMNWPNYIVWNNNQKKMIEKLAVSPASYRIANKIWFEDKKTDLPSVEKLRVIIFDVPPVRPSLYRKLGAPVEFYTREKMLSFVENICVVCKELEIKPCIKPKREYSSRVYDKGYSSKILKLARSDMIEIINPDISAVRLIEKTRFVIAAPFSSPAVLAKNAGKEVVYFDPTNTVLIDEETDFGIELINSPQELRNKLESVI